MAQMLKNPPAIQETGLIPELGRSPGEGSDNHSSNLAQRIP